MSIPDKYKGKYFFHFTHSDNLESILKNGLLSTGEKITAGIEHVDVAEESIQERRSKMKVPIGPKGVVHDYVPFYWSTTTAMFLSIVNSKNYDQQLMLFIALRAEKIAEDHVVFTDSSANTAEAPNFYSDPADLDKLDWKCIDNNKWSKGADDERHKKMSEVLIHKRVNIEEIDTIVVWNDWVKGEVLKVYSKLGIQPPRIDTSPIGGKHLFFTKFMVIGHENYSLVTGPRLLKTKYRECVKSINENRKTNVHGKFKFKNIEEAIHGIEKDFKAIVELEGIYQLETINEVHSENVSDHTLSVVAELKKVEYYKLANAGDKNILLLSAYLHDIGKGPKTKWSDGKQRSYPDHPADAPEMLERILSEDIKEISDEEIEMICLLVTYHDLIGEIIGKGRNIEQLFDIIKSEKEFDMLSTLNLADVNAIGGFFTWSYKSGIKNIKTQVLDKLAK